MKPCNKSTNTEGRDRLAAMLEALGSVPGIYLAADKQLYLQL